MVNHTVFLAVKANLEAEESEKLPDDELLGQMKYLITNTSEDCSYLIETFSHSKAHSFSLVMTRPLPPSLESCTSLRSARTCKHGCALKWSTLGHVRGGTSTTTRSWAFHTSMLCAERPYGSFHP